MRFSSRIEACELSPIRKFYPYMVAAEAKGRKVYHLNIGQPDLPTPQKALDALKNVEYTHALDEESEDCCWTVRKENGKTYLYNLGAKKFGVVGNNGAITLSETPVVNGIFRCEIHVSDFIRDLEHHKCVFSYSK